MVAMVLSLVSYFVYYWWKFDDFLLYFHFQGQSYYGHEATFPLWAFIASLRELDAIVPEFEVHQMVVLEYED